MDKTRLTGVVIRLFRDRGYGFIYGDDKLSRFMHAKEVYDFDHIYENARVSFISEGEPISHVCPNCGISFPCDEIKNNGLRALEVRLCHD